MKLLRSLFFSIYFISVLIILSASFVLMHIFIKKRWLVQLIFESWAKANLFGLKYICNITYEVRGLEHLPQDRSFIVASKHQSTWETMAMLILFARPSVFVLKKELLKVPFYGWAVARANFVPIDRAGGASVLKSMIIDAKHAMEEGLVLVVYPQGTRVAPDDTIENYPYQVGIYAIYRQLGNDYPIIPAALNSGIFWGRKSFFKNPGKILLEFFPQIASGLDRDAFMTELVSTIENGSKSLISETRDGHGSLHHNKK